ncbi:ATP-binding protein [Adlercreutzia muris]|uniref:Sensor-like histidine kinase SenX3 n=1 Tax=Adlercreutzia muris TaxID=1796610 RepID=A0A7C8FNX9_9ACTN|nr:ATP-binding protein [Adlercreutzia muris]KAB1648492.1 sensor histidine kinase [Adlercreutzia muris]MCR2029131.1 ATP-binding protein [Adlercreutzia muris]MCU7584906.1 ATP-binding protein [Adlercreutzia muris]
MIWLGVLCAALAVALVGWVVATERQMREMARNLATRGQSARPLALRFPTAAAWELAQEANHLIDEAAEEKRQLQKNLASFSHDVRTPLAGAQGYLQLYGMAVTDRERDECVAAAAERLTAMRGLVDALFEYAKADDGARALVVVPVDVGAVVAACVADLHPAFVERQWEPTVRLDEDVVAPADPEALARIVENALVNCLRHGAAAPAITLRRAATADGFTLAIANEAEGLEALDASRLFERFYRGDPSRRSGGSGLGLAIADALARAQGMTLTASLTDNRFTITLRG